MLAISVNQYSVYLRSFMNPSSQSYAKRFFDHVAKFAHEHGLWSSDQGLVVAVSGGPDSTALCLFASYLKDQGVVPSVRLLHVNHGHRAGLAAEEKFIRRLAAGLDLPITCFTLAAGELNPASNFEMQARERRHYLLKDDIVKKGQDEVLLSAHHLDDSFEWWLRQRLVSTHGESLGIPLVNGLWRRPFLCVSKKQILRLLEKLQIPFLKDPTSHDLRYERNYLRSFLQTESFLSRYPKALRHYVDRSNQEAFRLNKHILSSNHSAEIKIFRFVDSVFLSAGQQNPSTSAKLTEHLKVEIPKLSESARGNLALQIQKIIQAMASHKKGPFDLSGGVKAYLFPIGIFLISRKQRENWKQKDQELARQIQNGAQIPELHLPNHPAYPQFSQSSRMSKSDRFQASLWPNALKAAMIRGWRWKFHYQHRL